MLNGKLITEKRNKSNMTQSQLGELVRVSQGMISLIEAGKAKPSLDVLFGIAKALNVSLEELRDASSQVNVCQELT